LRVRSNLIWLFLAFVSLSATLLADTPTFTPSVTETDTFTPTPTPGEGFLSVNPTTFVGGSTGNTMNLAYTAGSSAWSPGGLLTIYFPTGMDAPNGSNFYVQPSQHNLVQNYGYSGQTVQVAVSGLSPGATLVFLYGYDAAGGFAVSTTQAALTFGAAAYPQAQNLGAGGQIAVTPALIVVNTATITPTITPDFTPSDTPTISPTFTISQTFTTSPTPTISPTFTVSPTDTPIGPQVGALYSYPNPFDMRVYDKCTFRFPNDSNARVTVFNLAGEPVREIPSSDIQGGQGWAIWTGVDDYGRKVTGGLYYVRIRGDKTSVKKFTVIR
jgi:hypothetical protein